MKQTRLVLALIGLACLACFTPMANRGRSWALPLTPEEAPLTFPAIASTAQSMGLRAEQATTSVTVLDAAGNQMQWAVVGTQYNLYLLPLNEKASEQEYRALKVQADEIWRLALEARQQANVGAAVIVNRQPPPPAQGHGQPPPPQPGGYVQPGAYAPQPVAAPPPPQPAAQPRPQCTFNSDCGAGFRCQFNQCVSDGSARLGQGVQCTFSSDCGPGMTCRFNKCYSDGSVTAPQGAQCTFSSDCGPGMTCRFGKCER